MPEVSKDVLVLIYRLLPGFLTAWVFFGLTAHKRGNPFERVVQALVYSVFIQIPVALIRVTLLGLGEVWSVGPWTEEVALFYSLPIAIALGLAFAWLANNNVVHRRLYGWGVSTRASYPTELFGLVNEDARRFVVLHLKDGRRLYGWPYEWPDYQDEGRFIIVQAEWLIDENERRPLTGVEKVILPASAVAMVETMEPQTRSRAAEYSDEEPV
jgi:hypothetical protein